jgi:cation transport ATPase
MFGEQDASVIENALRQIVGVSHVELLPSAKHAVIQWSEPATWDDIQSAMKQLGYRTDDAH